MSLATRTMESRSVSGGRENPPSGWRMMGEGPMRCLGQKYSPRMAVSVQRVSWVTYSKHWWKSFGRWTYGVVSFMGTPPPRGVGEIVG
jgi:hypothetical protein